MIPKLFILQKTLGTGNGFTRSCAITLSYVLNEIGRSAESSKILARVASFSVTAREEVRYSWACLNALQVIIKWP